MGPRNNLADTKPESSAYLDDDGPQKKVAARPQSQRIEPPRLIPGRTSECWLREFPLGSMGERVGSKYPTLRGARKRKKQDPKSRNVFNHSPPKHKIAGMTTTKR